MDKLFNELAPFHLGLLLAGQQNVLPQNVQLWPKAYVKQKAIEAKQIQEKLPVLPHNLFYLIFKKFPPGFIEI